MWLMSNASSLSFLLMIFSVAVYSNFSTTRTNKGTAYVGNRSFSSQYHLDEQWLSFQHVPLPQVSPHHNKLSEDS